MAGQGDAPAGAPDTRPAPSKRIQANAGDHRASQRAAEASATVPEQACMVCLDIPDDVAEQLAVPDGLPPEQLHVTLAYLGTDLDDEQRRQVAAVVTRVAAAYPPLSGTVGGLGQFPAGDSGVPVYVPVDVPGLAELRHDLVEQLRGDGLPVDASHGFTPHITVTYLQPGQELPLPVPPTPVRFDALTWTHGSRWTAVPLARRFAEASRAVRLMLIARLMERRAWNPDLHPRDRRGRFRRVGAADLLSGAVPVGLLSDRRINTILRQLSDDPTTDERVFYLLDAEMGRRDAAARYRQLVESVPDADELQRLPETQVMDLYAQIMAVDRDPDPDARARLEAELDRRTAVARAEAEQSARAFLARPLEEMSEDDLAQASRYASQLDDVEAMERIFVEWERRESAERARVEAERKAAAEAEAARLAADQAAARAEAERAAAQAAERDRLREQIRRMSDDELRNMSHRAVLGVGPEVDADTAELVHEELARRAAAAKEREDAQKLAAARRRWATMPVEALSDDELRDALADYEADGDAADSTRRRRREQLRDEANRRTAEAERRAAMMANAPTEPARTLNPVAKVGTIERYIHAYRTDADARAAATRLALAKRRALGLPDDADDKALKAAERSDPRPLAELAGMILAWYQHLARFDDTIPRDRVAQRQWLVGWPDEQPGPPLRPAQPPARVARAWQVWQEIVQQAQADRDNGDQTTADRVRTAIARAYGLPDDVDADEIRAAMQFDPRTDAQRGAAYIAEFRQLAQEQGVNPSDRLRYGPPDRGAKAGTRPGRRESTPEQSARIDELVARGWDYLDAYAEVHGLDVDALRREQARQTAGGSQKALRAAYDEYVSLQYLDAEIATRGHLLSKAGQAKRIDPISLFSGPMHVARRYASEELLRYWRDHPRLTFAEFRAQMVGRAAAARDQRLAASAGRDFV